MPFPTPVLKANDMGAGPFNFPTIPLVLDASVKFLGVSVRNLTRPQQPAPFFDAGIKVEGDQQHVIDVATDLQLNEDSPVEIGDTLEFSIWSRDQSGQDVSVSLVVTIEATEDVIDILAGANTDPITPIDGSSNDAPPSREDAADGELDQAAALASAGDDAQPTAAGPAQAGPAGNPPPPPPIFVLDTNPAVATPPPPAGSTPPASAPAAALNAPPPAAPIGGQGSAALPPPPMPSIVLSPPSTTSSTPSNKMPLPAAPATPAIAGPAAATAAAAPAAVIPPVLTPATTAAVVPAPAVPAVATPGTSTTTPSAAAPATPSIVIENKAPDWLVPSLIVLAICLLGFFAIVYYGKKPTEIPYDPNLSAKLAQEEAKARTAEAAAREAEARTRMPAPVIQQVLPTVQPTATVAPTTATTAPAPTGTPGATGPGTSVSVTVGTDSRWGTISPADLEHPLIPTQPPPSVESNGPPAPQPAQPTGSPAPQAPGTTSRFNRPQVEERIWDTCTGTYVVYQPGWGIQVNPAIILSNALNSTHRDYLVAAYGGGGGYNGNGYNGPSGYAYDVNNIPPGSKVYPNGYFYPPTGPAPDCPPPAKVAKQNGANQQTSNNRATTTTRQLGNKPK